jgi:uncharacterized protein (TIGR00255 family)
MTGFGKAQIEDEKRKINIELRSLNSKQLDLNLKTSAVLREKEAEIRAMVGQSLQRGKIDLSIYYENLEDPAIPTLNKEVIARYRDQLEALEDTLGTPSADTLLTVISRFPDIMHSEKHELQEEEWTEIKSLLNAVLYDVEAFRRQEGHSMDTDIRQRVDNIDHLRVTIDPYEAQRMVNVRNRLNDRLTEIEQEVDQNRLEQELVYYAEKFDITEEKVRLQNHIRYFRETLKSSSPAGKKLGFIVQEMGREINTIGSKANDSDIQRIVVEMKDELEKIREQILNIL